MKPLRMSVWKVLIQLKMGPPYDQAIPLLGIYLKQAKYDMEVHNNKGIETTQISIERGLNKQTMVHPLHATTQSLKRTKFYHLWQSGSN